MNSVLNKRVGEPQSIKVLLVSAQSVLSSSRPCKRRRGNPTTCGSRGSSICCRRATSTPNSCWLRWSSNRGRCVCLLFSVCIAAFWLHFSSHSIYFICRRTSRRSAVERRQRRWGELYWPESRYCSSSLKYFSVLIDLYLSSLNAEQKQYRARERWVDLLISALMLDIVLNAPVNTSSKTWRECLLTLFPVAPDKKRKREDDYKIADVMSKEVRPRWTFFACFADLTFTDQLMGSASFLSSRKSCRNQRRKKWRTW